MIYHILLLQNSLISKKHPKKFSPAPLSKDLPHTPRPRPAAFGKYAPPPDFPLATPMFTELKGKKYRQPGLKGCQ